jgi:hypothetical protein
MTVDTSRVGSRRALSLLTIDDLSAEVVRIVAVASAEKVYSLGNWTPAQVLWHIGKLIELSFDGFPFRYQRGPAWITRLIRFLSWRWLIWLAFRPGFQNPSYAAVLEPSPALTLAEAAAYFRQQIGRIRRGERMTQASGVEGTYSHEEWVYIHLRHAELHLSFLVEEGNSPAQAPAPGSAGDP